MWTALDACGQREGGQKRDFFVDVINGWPLKTMAMGVSGRVRGSIPKTLKSKAVKNTTRFDGTSENTRPQDFFCLSK